MRGLTDEVEVRRAPGGTIVRFRLRLPAASHARARPAPAEEAPRPASLQVSDTADGRCVQLFGDLDLAGVALVREELLAALAGGGAVLDLSGLDSLSSVGLGLVVEAVASAGGPGSVDVVLPDSGPARRALELTGLIPLLRPGS
jgi:anti-anti-sigma factor